VQLLAKIAFGIGSMFMAIGTCFMAMNQDLLGFAFYLCLGMPTMTLASGVQSWYNNFKKK
jgi:hypothetical protein